MALKDRRRRGPETKTSTLEVRVSQEEKEEFLNACQASGRTASDIIRDRMEGFVRRSSRRRLSMMLKSAALAAFLILVPITPVPGPVEPSPERDAPTVLTVEVVDADGRTLEERVLGLASPEQAAGLFSVDSIVSETRSADEEGVDIRMVVRSGA